MDKSILRSFTLPCYMNNVCFNNAFADLGASVSVMPLSTNLNSGLGKLAHTKFTVELADRTMKYPKGIAKNMLVGIGEFVFPVDFIILDMPEDIKVPLILERPFLSTAYAKINVFKRKITLRVREEKIIFKSVKPAKLRGDQVDDLMPTIEEGEVVEKFRARNDARMFFREVRINTKRFKGMITIHNGNEEVTYQMVQSNLSLKSLDLDYSSKNYVRKFLRTLPLKWRAKVTAIKEAKDLATLLLDELIGYLKVYEMILVSDGVAFKPIKEKVMTIAFKANVTRGQTSNDSVCQDGSNEDKDEKEEFNSIVKNL
nr:hypothetical protein [Tanacetum cinerariifolium]